MASNAITNAQELRLRDTLKIVILGDSMSAQNALLSTSVTGVLEQKLNHMGVPAVVYPCNRDGHTYYRANTVAYLGGLTAVQACIAHRPDVVIMLLGINDSLLEVDGRTLAQIKADAATTVTTIKAALPSVKIVYVSQIPYDITNFTPATCKNKGIPMYFHKLNTAGILANSYTNEIQDALLAPATSAALDNWVALDAYITALPDVDLNFPLNLWKCARLGGTGNDGVHLNPGGVALATGYLLEGLRGLTPEFSSLLSNGFDWWEDPDYLFSQLMTPSGDGYTYSGDLTSENQNILSGSHLHPITWYLPRQASLEVTDNITDAGSAIFRWSITGAQPLTQVKVSVNGAAFVNAPGALTDAHGNITGLAAGADVAGLSVGVNTLRYSVGNIVFEPKTVAYGPYAPPWVAITLVATWTAVSPGATYDVPGVYVDKFKHVRLRGVITGGVNGSLFTVLPAAYRPPKAIFLGLSTTAFCQINPNGECFITSSATSISLNSLEFDIA
jgi:lysophospholipase L1-like esterase